VLNGSRVINT